MKRHITFFVTVVISWSAQADPAKPISWEEAKATQGFLPNAVLEAGDKVEFLSTGSACSGQFISSTGVYLTAMHCLMKSIMNEGPKLRIESGDSPPHFKAWSVQDPSQLPFQTRAVPDSWYLRAMNEPNEPKVLALGGGFFEFPPNISSFSEFDLIQKKTADFAKFQEDYGILKFELEKPESHHCLKISKSDPSSEEEVWAIGYPDEFIGTNQEPKKFVTKTKVFLTLHELKASTKVFATYPEEAWLDTSRFFLLSGKIKSGMSGGAVLNKDGHMLGIIVARTRSDDGIVLKTSFVTAAAKKTFTSAKFVENFKCEQ